MEKIQIKRVYDEPGEEDGYRVLVDRIWPRGLSKDKAKVDLWIKDIAPSMELRKWFSHDPQKWQEFKKKYLEELEKRGEVIAQLQEQMKKKKITLVYGAKDKSINQAVVLLELLKK